MTRPYALNCSTAPTVLHTLITLTCPTTGRAYTVDDALVAMVGDHAVVWSRCAWCDALGHHSGALAISTQRHPRCMRGLFLNVVHP